MALDFIGALGGSSNKKFLLRDFRNAARFAPGVNPPRQKFEGYVNFILNRDLYALLYENAAKDEFRTQISSLVRTADLPSVVFQTETKNAYNKKKIINTGVTYNPVNITVFDTIGNEWLTTLMKYFSYNFMDPRNQQKGEDRDIFAGQPRTGGVENIGPSAFGQTSETNKFDSNIAGYNINESAQFFERIDYVLYHGNRGVQYSIINPMMSEFKPGNIDYASSDLQEFTMTFDYERFTVYNKLNFELGAEDVDRFEELGAITGDLFEPAEKPLILETTRTLGPNANGGPGILGSEEEPRARSKQPIIAEPATGDSDTANVTPSGPEANATYSVGYDKNQMAGEREFGDTIFTDIIGDVADSALSAVLRGQSVKDAIISTAVHRASTAIGSSIANSIAESDAISNTSPNPAGNVGGP